MLYFWVAIGGAIGTVCRFWCSGFVARLVGETFPFGTLVINVIGSFIIGFAATAMGPDGRLFAGTTARQFVMTGLCGGYTTFSSFSLQTLNLLNDGEWLYATGNARILRRSLHHRGVGRSRPCGQPQCDAVGVNMQVPRDAMLLRIFFGEDDKSGHLPLHEAIVLKAREMHLAGATVLRGHIGFGHSTHIHTTKILRLSQDLPVVVEIVDSQEKIEGFLPVVNSMMSGGLVTIEKVQVLQYGADGISPIGRSDANR